MKYENSILHGKCQDVVDKFPDDSIDLVVTSPPYNVGTEYGEYNDNIHMADYSLMIQNLFQILSLKVKDDGRVCVNVALNNSDGIIDLPAIIKDIAYEQDWDLRFEIIWNKGSSESSSAWGSWRSPSSPRPIFNHEYILIFDVGNGRKDSEKVIEKERFMQIVKSVWNVNPETSSKHPASFPEEIPRRLIELNSYEEDVILDPFVGSGTTALVAEKMNRKWIGVDLDKDYIDMSMERIESETSFVFDDRSVFDF